MENITKRYSKEDRPTYAYTVLSHLVSEHYMNFVDMKKLLGISHDGFWYRDLLAYIVNGIENLEKESDESIPRITALVFDKHGKSSKWACGILARDRTKQPTPQQIKKFKTSVAAYDKWDKVLEYFSP